MLDFNKAFTAQLEQRNKVLSDQRFVDVSGAQWDGSYGEQFKNRPRMEMDKISREINRIIGEYNSNPITVRYIPDSSGSTEKVANIMTDRFRNDSRKSQGQEATDNAFTEAVKGGFGAFRLLTKYENEDDPEQNEQYIAFEEILSAASVVVWDPDAKRFDKSDSKKCWVLHEMTRDKFNEEYPGKAPFSDVPVTDYNVEFDWFGKEVVYVAEYYEVKKKKRTRLVFEKDGQKHKIFSEDMTDMISVEMIEYNQVGQERVTQTYVEKSLICGDAILEKAERIPGKNIPVVPCYGYRSYIKGRELYMGEVRKQRDRQTFYNMATSMLAEIMGESHKEKPIVAPEQMAGHEEMWARNGVDNYPALYLNPLKDDITGQTLAPGPVGTTKAPEIPPALTGAISMLNQDIAEELGTGEVSIPSNTSGNAVQQIQNRADMSYFILIHNMRKSMRRAGDIYKSMAKEVYGVQRELRTLSEDGSHGMTNLMEIGFDETNLPTIKNDLSVGEYEAVVISGKSYSSKMQAERDTLLSMMQATDSNNPMYNLLFNEVLQKVDGEGADTIKRVARHQELQMLIGMNPKIALDDARNEEEEAEIMQMIQASQQKQQQPDPAMIMAAAQDKLANAEVMKAQTDQASVQIKAVTAQSDAQLKQAQTIKTYAEAEDVSKARVQDGIKIMQQMQQQNQKTMQDRMRSIGQL